MPERADRGSRSVFVVDDEPGICRALERFLARRGDMVRSFPRAEEALEAARDGVPDVVLLDVRLPGMSGLDAVREFRALPAPPAVLVMTAHGTLDVAVEALRRGAVDYLPKPLDLEQVAAAVIRATVAGTPLPGGEPGSGPALVVGRSPPVQDLFRRIAALALSDVPVLVVGESGSGKELVARAIHGASRRATGPFEPVDCASLPETLLESELFGYERGAFTGAFQRRTGRLERADGGTLFLDEVGEIPLASQARLLRFLETRTFERLGGERTTSVDTRVVTATHRDLAAAVAEGTFREDLYYRLNVVTLRVPPLRDRPEDIPLLVAHFLGMGDPAPGISAEALDLLTAHRWPGNVRELRNAVEHARALARGAPIAPGHLPPSLRTADRGADEDPADGATVDALVRRFVAAHPGGGTLHADLVARLERPLIREVLSRTGGNQVQAARILGIHRTTLRERMARHGLDGGDGGEAT